MTELSAFVLAFNNNDPEYLTDLDVLIEATPVEERHFFYNTEEWGSREYEGKKDETFDGEISDFLAREITDNYDIIHLYGGLKAMKNLIDSILKQFSESEKQEITFGIDQNFSFDFERVPPDNLLEAYRLRDRDARKLIEEMDFSKYGLQVNLRTEDLESHMTYLDFKKA